DTMSQQKITDIDLAKTNFYLFSINAHGKPAGRIKLSRNQLLNWLVQQPKMTVAMEARGHPITGPGKSGNSTMM
ncbi:transposase, partial [Escherichia coli]